jgi:hypothetical protein
MYDSPIDKIIGEMQSQLVKDEEGQLMVQVSQTIGYNIDKDELIKALNYDRQQYEKGYKDGLNASKWNSVTDRLPDKEDWYLVTEVDGSFITVNMRLWTTEGWIVPQIIEDKLNILAWMPLPEPYKVVNEVDV